MPRLIDNPQPTVTADKVVITESGPCVWAVGQGGAHGRRRSSREGGLLHGEPEQPGRRGESYGGGRRPRRPYAITMADSTHLNWVSTEGASGAARAVQHQLAVPAVNEGCRLAGITQNNLAGLESGQVKAMFQAAHIVWNKTIKCQTGTCVRSFDVDTVANTVKSDDFSMAGTELFYGASGFDKYGTMWLLMASTKPAGFVGLSLAGRSPTGQVRAPKEIVAGQAGIPGGGGLIRFGDFVAAAQDPVDGSTLAHRRVRREGQGAAESGGQHRLQGRARHAVSGRRLGVVAALVALAVVTSCRVGAAARPRSRGGPRPAPRRSAGASSIDARSAPSGACLAAADVDCRPPGERAAGEQARRERPRPRGRGGSRAHRDDLRADVDARAPLARGARGISAGREGLRGRARAAGARPRHVRRAHAGLEGRRRPRGRR